MHWWNASWLASPDARSAEERAAHETGVAILEDHAATGRPFALYLHAFSSRQYYGADPDGNGGMLLDACLDGALQRVGARMIKVQDQAGELSYFVPGLLLENATWQHAVNALMSRAELIVSECSVLSPGVVAELQALADLKKFDRTVLILPSPPLEFVGNKDDVQVFARAIHQHELIQENPARTFVFRDLIERIERIGKIDPGRRLELIETGRLDGEVGVSFRGVPEGLVRLAKEYAHSSNVGAAYFSGSRAVKVAELAFPISKSMRLKLRIADFYGKAGNFGLAITEFDEIEKVVATATSINPRSGKQLVDATRRSRAKWLGAWFQQLQLKGENAELWQLAGSQASAALARNDTAAMAQCFSWMAVAALAGKHFDAAREKAQDAIRLARISKDRYREGFASVYLGQAQQQLGRDLDALKSYLQAVEQLAQTEPARIHVIALLLAAQMAELLRPAEQSKPLYESARTLAMALNQRDLKAAAEEGLARLVL